MFLRQRVVAIANSLLARIVGIVTIRVSDRELKENVDKTERNIIGRVVRNNHILCGSNPMIL